MTSDQVSLIGSQREVLKTNKVLGQEFGLTVVIVAEPYGPVGDHECNTGLIVVIVGEPYGPVGDHEGDLSQGQEGTGEEMAHPQAAAAAAAESQFLRCVRFLNLNRICFSSKVES